MSFCRIEAWRGVSFGAGGLVLTVGTIAVSVFSTNCFGDRVPSALMSFDSWCLGVLSLRFFSFGFNTSGATLFLVFCPADISSSSMPFHSSFSSGRCPEYARDPAGSDFCFSVLAFFDFLVGASSGFSTLSPMGLSSLSLAADMSPSRWFSYLPPQASYSRQTYPTGRRHSRL